MSNRANPLYGNSLSKTKRAHLLFGKRWGWVGDFEMSQRTERPRFTCGFEQRCADADRAECAERTASFARDGVDLSMPGRNDVYDFEFLEN
jgi:hypothetical protein